jgi:hypothetical protein
MTKMVCMWFRSRMLIQECGCNGLHTVHGKDIDTGIWFARGPAYGCTNSPQGKAPIHL